MIPLSFEVLQFLFTDWVAPIISSGRRRWKDSVDAMQHGSGDLEYMIPRNAVDAGNVVVYVHFQEGDGAEQIPTFLREVIEIVGKHLRFKFVRGKLGFSKRLNHISSSFCCCTEEGEVKLVIILTYLFTIITA